MAQKTLQIATFGQEQEGIKSGLRNFPVHKLILFCYQDDLNFAEEFSRDIEATLAIPTQCKVISPPDIIKSCIDHISGIIKNEGDNYDQILINVSAGEKMLGCAALSCAFVNGIKAFGTDMSGQPMLLPILKLSYNEMVSDAKISILNAIDHIGGKVDGLEKLERNTDFGKPLLSYHINGNKETKGLVQLGLVDTEKNWRGKNIITLNAMGKILISNADTTSEKKSEIKA